MSAITEGFGRTMVEPGGRAVRATPGTTAIRSGSPRTLRSTTDTSVDPSPRWSALRFDLRGVAKREQIALWRELRRIRALKLCPGTWAVAHGANGRPPLTRAIALLEESIGPVEVVDPDVGSVGEALDHHLHVACQRLWDTFFNDLDRFADAVTAGEDAADADSGPDLEGAFDLLCASFVQLSAKDLIGREGRRARTRMQEATRSFAARLGDQPRAVTKPRRPTALADLVHAVQLRDGSVRHTVAIDPTPTFAWEQQFHAFEDLVYLPAPGRPALEFRSFSFTVAPAMAAATMDGIARRIATFELSLPASPAVARSEPPGGSPIGGPTVRNPTD
jgi:hypothetical protein